VDAAAASGSLDDELAAPGVACAARWSALEVPFLTGQPDGGYWANHYRTADRPSVRFAPITWVEARPPHGLAGVSLLGT